MEGFKEHKVLPEVIHDLPEQILHVCINLLCFSLNELKHKYLLFKTNK